MSVSDLSSYYKDLWRYPIEELQAYVRDMMRERADGGEDKFRRHWLVWRQCLALFVGVSPLEEAPVFVVRDDDDGYRKR